MNALTKHMMNTARVLSVLLVATAIGACGSWEPYGELSIAHQIDKNSDYYRQTERAYECSNPAAHIEAGVEKGPWKIGYHHQSWVTCGGPFNKGRPETYADDIRITYKIGGQK